MRVGILGYGTIGRRVAGSLHNGGVPGVGLTGVHTRTPGGPTRDGLPELSETELIARSDLVVEVAGVAAARTTGVRIVTAGTDLLLTSVGAVADPGVREQLLETGPGRTYLTSGAVGGLDLLAAAALGGGIAEAALTTTKSPAAVVGPWLEESARRRILGTKAPLTVFEGTVVEAIERFPASLNVAVALAAATGLWEQTRVRFVADPSTLLTRHEISAAGPAGAYSFSIQNEPEPGNPASSGVVADAVVKGIRTLAGASGSIV